MYASVNSKQLISKQKAYGKKYLQNSEINKKKATGSGLFIAQTSDRCQSQF